MKSPDKSQWAKKRIFTHFQAKVFENLISKNDFQWSDCFEYVSNLSHMIKIIIMDGSYSRLDPYEKTFRVTMKKTLDSPCKRIYTPLENLPPP